MTTAFADPEATDADRMQAVFDGALRDELGFEQRDLALARRVAGLSYSRGAYADAMKSYATLVLIEPANVENQVGLAESALQGGVFPIALQASSLIVMLAPSDPRGYLFSGLACSRMGLPTEAREDLERAAALGTEGEGRSAGDRARQMLAVLGDHDGPPAPAADAR